MAVIIPLSAELQQQLEDLQQQALALLRLAPELPPHEVVAVITEYVRDAKAQRREVDDDAVFALGALLGRQFVLGLGWHWGDVTWDDDPDTAAIGVLNPDDSLFNNPIGWVSQALASEGGVAFMLSYNMIQANQTPVFEPGSATGLY
ncbi:hypothetical protein N7414_24935 [Pseudomonas sp. GD04087]|uniref:hypothetical protein n=1 Tax=unclassified Pseudomonas TaxID=196821 RepID=UPI00244C7403|nr:MULTISPECIES: hypothetical protein [unclassified Pseudomonas]MDH0292379.1 hypothetical protein [Pseudomonas sp. GD04087]MDH1048847.1 hypothetical protein [Pseudomonas sp. GD03903]MDH1999447.1 hypothetical protein [Pseudomonas sp. GD03691]